MVPIYYARYLRKDEIIDEDSNSTGEYNIVYSSPLSSKANVSAAIGENSTRQFGDSTDYDKVIIFADRNLEIDETSILWIDNLDTRIPHDYIVKKVARSLNGLSVSVKKVNVSA